MFLTPAEINELTGKTRKPAQRRALNSMGITHQVRPDGAVIVLRSHIEKVFDGNIANKVKKEWQPDWSSFNA